jgi:putative ABC transport system permease protein
MTYVDLTYGDLALAAGLILVNGLISLGFGLRLEASLAAAAARMVVQLGLLGFLLKLVFEHASLLWTGLAALALVAVAGWELLRRQGHRFRGLFVRGSGHLLLLAVGGLATLCGVLVIDPTPWYAPRYVLPILAMVTGGTLATAAVALQTLIEGALSERAGIEARMALGAGRFTAFLPLLRRTLQTALTPLLQTMSIAGVAVMPGVMSGQMLAGADPVAAAKYQIMLLCLVTGAAGLGACIAAIGGVLLLTDMRHRLRLDRLRPQAGGAH